MSPDKEAQTANCEDCENHRAISEDRLARKGGKNVRGRTHSGKNRDVDFRVSKEPEQVLPEQRRAAIMQRHQAAADIQTSGNEKARAGDSIEQQKDSAAEQHRE